MLLDARSLPPNEVVHADICIVGAGPAGIAIASTLVNHPARVVLLESGGTAPDEACQDLYRGVTTGRPYFSLDACRIRYLGGSTNVWGGWCRPLDALDFEEREWMPYSGWPFGKERLDPYYRRAQAACKLGPYEYDAQHWRSADERSVVSQPSDSLTDTVFQIRPLRFGPEYRPLLQRAGNIRLMLHANALEIEMDAQSATVIRGATLAGNRFSVAARLFVLASGGIENPRLLLASRRAHRCGVGNEHDLVGRFFTEHLHVPVGIVHPNRRLSFYQAHRAHGAIIRGLVSLTEHVRRRDRLYGCGLSLHNADDPHDVLRPTEQPASYQSLQYLVKTARERQHPRHMWRHAGIVLADLSTAAALSYRKFVKPPARTLIIGCRAEQAPDPRNRVELDSNTDGFGMPRARVHWEPSGNDLLEIRRAQRVWLSEFERAGLKVEPIGAFEDATWTDTVIAAAHHIGTTRMHQDPKMGVVDENSRVHGTSNVYVAGSSVFPTAGWAPPTLTIVALALRLGDHLKETLSRGPDS